MSNGSWRTNKRIEPFELGKTTTSRAITYVQTWEDRCYSNGIPDSVTDELSASGRVPSYKAIAVAILKNDIGLSALGFEARESKWYGVLKKIEIEAREDESDQLSFSGSLWD